MGETEDMPILRHAYDELAERYADLTPTKLENACLDKPETLSLLPPVRGCVILDAGCGAGAYAEWFIRHGAMVIAFDVSPRMVELSRKPGFLCFRAAKPEDRRGVDA